MYVPFCIISLLDRLFSLQETQYRVSAYDSIVTIVEPEISLLDWKLYVSLLRRFDRFGQRLNPTPPGG